jgi:hypothetical protein
MKRWMMLAACLALTTTAACDDDKPDESKSSDDDSDSGLAHPDNDKAVVKLAKSVLDCKWKSSEPDYKCKAKKAWGESKLLEKGENDATLLNMLDDEDSKVRYLAYDGLDDGRSKWRANKKQAKRVLKTAAAESDEKLGRRAGRVIGIINVEKTKTAKAIKKVLADNGSTGIRQGIVSSILFNNKKVGGFYDVLQKIAREDDDKDVRKAAGAAFWTGGHARHDDTCKLWLELSSDADDDVAGHSAYHCSWWSHDGGCTGQWDALLDGIHKRAKAGKVDSTFMTSSLGWLLKQKKATAAQKRKVKVVAKSIVANPKNSKSAQSAAKRILDGKK